MTTIKDWIEMHIPADFEPTPVDNWNGRYGAAETIARLSDPDCEGSDEVLATILTRRQGDKVPEELDWKGIALPDGRTVAMAKFQHPKTGLAYAMRLINGERETALSLTPEIMIAISFLTERICADDMVDLKPVMVKLEEQALAVKTQREAADAPKD